MSTIAALHQIVEASAQPDLVRDAASPEPVETLIVKQLQPDLPAHHDAWQALAGGRYRSDQGPVHREDTRARLGRLDSHLQRSLTSPDAPGNAVSDYLTELAISRLISDAFVLQADRPHIENALSLAVGDARHYPAFQFSWGRSDLRDDAQPAVFAYWSVVAPSGPRSDPEQAVTYALRVHPLIPYSADTLDAEADPVGCIGWWLTGNSWLASTPAELLNTPREPEIMHALDQLDNDSW